jgi:hypothetical protein
MALFSVGRTGKEHIFMTYCDDFKVDPLSDNSDDEARPKCLLIGSMILFNRILDCSVETLVVRLRE